MSDQGKVLLIEDSATLSAVYQAYLSDEPYEVKHAADLAAARELLAEYTPDIILLDLELPDGNGLEILDQMIEEKRPVDVIIMTAYGSSSLAVDAIKTGAFDFLTKPFDAARLLVTIENAAKYRTLNRQVEILADLERESYCGFIGKSIPMQSVYKTIDSLAVSSATGFITGESGTGKELAAEAIHQESKRNEMPLVAINCAAIPHDLMESELFGHVKGAFTGAVANREGAAAEANGGTLFLDEICELDLGLQKKLLRFIQTGTFQKVGSNKTEQVDIRFVCATNRDPLKEVQEGRFREDLYYRLHVVPVELPPLRDRDEDVVMIANHFLSEMAEAENREYEGFSRDAVELLLSYGWPGNVRELQNVVQRTVVLNHGGLISADMLPISRAAPASAASAQTELEDQPTEGFDAVNPMAQKSTEIEPLWLVEKRAIEHAIAATGNNINKAAVLLDVAPSTLYRKMQSWKKDQAAG